MNYQSRSCSSVAAFAQNGQSSAFVELFNQRPWQEKVRKVIAAVLSKRNVEFSPSDIDAIVSEVNFALCQNKMKSWDSEKSYTQWVLGLTANKTFDFLRRQARQKTLDPVQVEQLEDSAAADSSLAESIDTLLYVLETLKRSYSSALLHGWKEKNMKLKTQKQIAKELGLKESTLCYWFKKITADVKEEMSRIHGH